MTAKVFPTEFSALASVSLTTKVMADDGANGTATVDQIVAAGQQTVTVAQLPSAAARDNQQYLVSDAQQTLASNLGGTVDAGGRLFFSSALTTHTIGSACTTAGVTIDTTVDQVATVTATWGAANASNTITLRQINT